VYRVQGTMDAVPVGEYRSKEMAETMARFYSIPTKMDPKSCFMSVIFVQTGAVISRFVNGYKV
jgi:hypothetical protein